MIKIQYTTRRGKIVTRLFGDQRVMWVRYTELVEQEVQTRKHAPTDSGDVRFENMAEATALGKRLCQANI